MDDKEMEEVHAAKKQVVEGNLILWRTRLATVARIHGSSAATDLLQRPVEPAEDTFNQNFGSGVCCPPPRPGGVVIPGEPTITTVPPPRE